MANGQITITFQNFGGTGFGGSRSMAYGTTAAQFFRAEMGGSANPGSYRISVNGLAAREDQVLQDGDVVIFTTSQKHEGAC